jgi:glycosyltransferase involved in cell wall biosynthesis
MASQTSDPPLVSAVVITYAQESLIAQAIESILMQQCDFPFEIIVGEDCSPDGTRQVLQALQQRYPDRIRLILHDANVGFMRNIQSVFKAARGEFVAFLEGDDYWLVNDKLAQQVAALRAFPEIDIVFSSGIVEYPDGSKKRSFDFGPYQRLVTAGELCSRPGMMLPTGSIMFRRDRLEALPAAIYDAPVLDTFLVLGLAAGAGAWYLPQAMSAYRLGAPNSWTERMATLGPARLQEYYEAMISSCETLLPAFGLDATALYNRTKGSRWDLLRLRQREGQWLEVLRHANKLGFPFLMKRVAALGRQLAGRFTRPE